MHQIVFVLLVAGSALAVPTQDRFPAKYENKIVSSVLFQRTFDFIDCNDKNLYVIAAEKLLEDLANIDSKKMQTVALSQAITLIGLSSTGIPGNICLEAGFINDYTSSMHSDDVSAINQAVASYVTRYIDDLEVLITLVRSPNDARFYVGPQGDCQNGGRIYDFEGAWKAIMADRELKEITNFGAEYYVSKNLYNAFDVRSNNVGAAMTIMALSPIEKVFNQAYEPMIEVMTVLAYGGDITAAVENMRSALREAIANY